MKDSRTSYRSKVPNRYGTLGLRNKGCKGTVDSLDKLCILEELSHCLANIHANNIPCFLNKHSNHLYPGPH